MGIFTHLAAASGQVRVAVGLASLSCCQAGERGGDAAAPVGGVEVAATSGQHAFGAFERRADAGQGGDRFGQGRQR